MCRENGGHIAHYEMQNDLNDLNGLSAEALRTNVIDHISYISAGPNRFFFGVARVAWHVDLRSN